MGFSDRFLSRMKLAKGEEKGWGGAEGDGLPADRHTHANREGDKKKTAQLPLALMLRLAADTVTVTEQRCEAKTFVI